MIFVNALLSWPWPHRAGKTTHKVLSYASGLPRKGGPPCVRCRRPMGPGVERAGLCCLCLMYMADHLPAGKVKGRACDCGNPMPPRARYCPDCRRKRRRASDQRSKRQLSSFSPTQVVGA